MLRARKHFFKLKNEDHFETWRQHQNVTKTYKSTYSITFYNRDNSRLSQLMRLEVLKFGPNKMHTPNHQMDVQYDSCVLSQVI